MTLENRSRATKLKCEGVYHLINIIIIEKSFINGITFIKKNTLPVSRLCNKIQEKTMILKITSVYVY